MSRLIGLVAILLVGPAWAAKPAIKCPAGTELIGAAPPQGTEVYCQKRLDTGEFVKHGPYRSWAKAGVPLVVGEFDEGLETGEWTQFHGGIEVDGRWSDAKNQPKYKGRYESGKEVGLWSAWHPNGQLGLQTTYVNGAEDGVARGWFPNGRRQKEVSYQVGVRHGPRLEWYENGSPKIEANYVLGYLDGPWLRWSEDGNPLERGSYLEGKPAGKWKAWSGPGEVSWAGEFDTHGVAQGRWFHCFHHLVAEKVCFDGEVVNGLRDGLWTTRNKSAEYTVHFKAGELHGRCESRWQGKLEQVIETKDRFYRAGCLPFGLPDLPTVPKPD